MTTDPRDAGIARYDLDLMESRMVKDQWGGEWVRHSDHAAEIARLTAEVETLTTSGIIEVAARNPNVMSYIQHWETRTEKAEAECDEWKALYTARKEKRG
jgi:hypothetical protein